MPMMRRIALLSLVLVAFPAAAQQPKSLGELEKQESLQEALETIDQMQSGLNAMIRKRELDCMRAIGYQPFCGCVMEALPVAWTFADYIAITTRSKDQNGYTKLDAEFKAAYDQVPGIRDRCVQRINAKR